MSLYCLLVVLCSIMSHVTITANINFIPKLNDSKFKLWQENLLVVLTIMDLVLALTVNSPLSLTNKSPPDDKKRNRKVREIKSHVYDDYEEDHFGSIQGLNV